MITHNMTHSRIYNVWAMMIQRCTNPKAKNYKNYGGRGISVCDTWNTFEHFYKDMGDPPSGMQLERKDNKLGYSLNNCRWATPKENARNRRSSVFIEIDGIKKTLIEWCESVGIDHHTYRARRKRGWSIEESLFTPVSRRMSA